MKVESKGILIDRFSRKYKTKDGAEAVSATVIIKEGENNGYPIIKVFETNKTEIIDRITKLKINDNVECSGYLNGIYGTSKDGNKYAMSKVSLNYIALLKEEQNNDVQASNLPEGTDPLPF